MTAKRFFFPALNLLICSAALTGSLFSQQPNAPVAKGREGSPQPKVPAAQSREAQNRELLAKYDHNKNGVLDEDEIENIGRDRLLRWDKNKDGKMDQADLKAMRAESRTMPKQDEATRKRALLKVQMHRKEEEERLRKVLKSQEQSTGSAKKNN